MCYNGVSDRVDSKVHKNPDLWTMNKTGVGTVMVFSCINSVKSN